MFAVVRKEPATQSNQTRWGVETCPPGLVMALLIADC